MDNIPQGYDENGVRSGLGKWIMSEDVEEIKGATGSFDEYDFLREIDKGHFVECARCERLVNIQDAIKTWFGTGYLCENCAKESEV